MAQERVVSQEENKSMWKSRLFKIGLVTAAAGAVLKWWNVAATGVIIAGAAWALWKGESKG